MEQKVENCQFYKNLLLQRTLSLVNFSFRLYCFVKCMFASFGIVFYDEGNEVLFIHFIGYHMAIQHTKTD